MKKILLLSVLISSLFVLSANAQTWNQVIKACASDRTANDIYGFSLAISGDFAIVGAYWEDDDVNGLNTLANSGSAYILQNIAGTWTQIQKIVASDRSGADYFGYSVAIDGDYAIVGAYNEAQDASGLNTFAGAGSAYIFHNVAGTWSQTQKIVASDRNTSDFFGSSVSISGDYLIVGAYQEDENAAGASTLSNSGSAYIFKNTAGTWAQQQKIVASDRSAADFFAYSVAISGDYAIVGAYSEDENASGSGTLAEAGSAYIFLRSGTTWSQAQKIVASDRAASDYFGFSVAISGNFAIVGAYQEDENASGGATLAAAGSAYIFVNNAGTWSQANKIVNTDRAAGDQFGYSVSISGDYALIGANLEDEDAAGANNMFSAGSAYIFKNTAGSWAQQQKIVPTDRGNSDLFGTAVAMSGTSILVGAYQEDHDATGANPFNSAGSVYFFGPAGAEINVKQNLTNIADGGSYDFGNVVAGNSSGAITFTIGNVGSADLSLTGTPKIEISGVNSAYFTVVQTAVTSPVAAASSTSFTISFNPGAVASFSAQISIANDDSDENPYNFVINGTGTKIPQTITNFGAITAKTYGDAPFVVSAIASSGLDVVFTSSDPTVATCTGTNGTTITILKAGNCDIRANQAGNALFDAAPQVVQALTVNTKTITVTAQEKTKIYGDADPLLTYTFTPALVVGDNFTGALTRVAGECGVCYAEIQQGTLALNINYTLVYVPADLIINKRPVSVTATAGQNKVYGAGNPSYSYSITSGSLAFSDGFSGSLTRVAGENVGNYAIQQGTLAINANYILTFVSNNFQITQKPITISVDPFQSKIYRQANPTYTYIASPALVSGDTFSGSLIREAGENVGFYEILQGSLTAGSNYILTYNSDDFEIEQKPITVMVYTNQFKTYGQTNPIYAYYLVGSLEIGDSFTGVLGRIAGENVGLYPINMGTLSAGPNYNLTINSQNFEILIRPITVTIDANQTKTYGNSDPTLTYSLSSALISGDSFTGSVVRQVGENIGFYTIQQGSLALSSNYSMSFVEDDFEITIKPIVVTANPNQFKYYGNADPIFTYSVTGSLAFSDVFSGSLTRVAGENTGLYAIQQGSLSLNSNYNLTYNSANFEILGVHIIVTVDPNQSKEYGQSDPIYTYTYTGTLAVGDDFTGSLGRTTGEDVGLYEITQGDLALNQDYSIEFITDDFEITTKPIAVTADANQTKIYGDSDPAFTYSIVGILETGDDFSGELSRVAGENIGTYAIQQGNLSLSSNYDLSYVGDDFEITIKALTVTADPGQTKEYGADDPVFTYGTSEPLVVGDAFTGILDREFGDDAGLYAINQGSLLLNSNYNLSFVSNDFEIIKATPIIDWQNPEDIYTNTVLSSTQLNAFAGIAGSYVYDPAAGTLLSFGTNQELNVSFTPSDALNYNIAYKTVYINVLWPVNLNEVNNNQISIYPNPTNGIVWFDLPIGTVSEIQICDVSGKIIFNETNISSFIDLSDLPAGVYIVDLKTDKNNYRTRVVLQ